MSFLRDLDRLKRAEEQQLRHLEKMVPLQTDHGLKQMAAVARANHQQWVRALQMIEKEQVKRSLERTSSMFPTK